MICGRTHITWTDPDGNWVDGNGAIYFGVDVSDLVAKVWVCGRPADHPVDDPFDCHAGFDDDGGECHWPDRSTVIHWFEA